MSGRAGINTLGQFMVEAAVLTEAQLALASRATYLTPYFAPSAITAAGAVDLTAPATARLSLSHRNSLEIAILNCTLRRNPTKQKKRRKMIRGRLTPSVVVCLAVLTFLIVALPKYSAQAQSGGQDPTNQTPTPTPGNEELRKLRERNELLEEKKKAALLEKEILETKFPKPSTTPLEGKTTVSDGAIIESQVVAYRALARAADEIICQLKKLSGAEDQKCVRETAHPTSQPAPTPLPMKKLAIYEGTEVNQVLGYGIAKERLRLVEEEYKKLLAPLPSGTQEVTLGPLTIAQSFLGSIVDLTALLRTNVDIKGQSFSIEKASLVSEVFRAARESELRADLYFPAEFPLNVDVNAGYQFLTRLEQLHGTQSVSAQLVADWLDNGNKLLEYKGRPKAQQDELTAVQAEVKTTQDRLEQTHNISCPKLPQEFAARIKEMEELLVNLQGEARERVEADLRELRLAKCRGLSSAMELKIEDLETLYVSLRAKEKELMKKLPATVQAISELEKRRGELIQKLHLDWRSKSRVDEAMLRLKTLNDQFAQFVAALAKVDDATGLNLLTSYLKTDGMSEFLKDCGVYWLQLQVVNAGGNNRIKTNLLVDIFTGGNRVSHSGGVIAQYILYDKTGKVVGGDTIPIYTGYISSKKVEKLFK